jgi:hypothetical protein
MWGQEAFSRTALWPMPAARSACFMVRPAAILFRSSLYSLQLVLGWSAGLQCCSVRLDFHGVVRALLGADLRRRSDDDLRFALM